MICDPSPELDFSDARRLAFEREQKEAQNWTEEALCLAWMFGRNPIDWEWWKNLKIYDREAWLTDYRFGREIVENGGRMPTFGQMLSSQEENWKQIKAIAQSWSIDIRAAFKDSRLCPIKPARGFEVALDMAIDLAGIPSKCLAPYEEETP